MATNTIAVAKTVNIKAIPMTVAAFFRYIINAVRAEIDMENIRRSFVRAGQLFWGIRTVMTNITCFFGGAVIIYKTKSLIFHRYQLRRMKRMAVKTAFIPLLMKTERYIFIIIKSARMADSAAVIEFRQRPAFDMETGHQNMAFFTGHFVMALRSPGKTLGGMKA